MTSWSGGQTRIAAADGADIDAVVVAAVALERLGLADRVASVLAADQVVPQVGQGAIAIEHRNGDAEAASVVAAVIDADTTRCVNAERAYLAELGGGCDLPVGAHATLVPGGVELTVVLSSLDGRVMLRATDRGTDGDALGRQLAALLLDERGGRQLLDDSRGGPES